MKDPRVADTSADNVASFPTCPTCGSCRLDPVSDAPICFRLADGPAQTIPRSQNAQLLRFLWQMKPLKVVGDHLYLALDHCRQESRAIATLRGKWKIPIHCDDIPKVTKAGTYGLYYLGDGVVVWEPESGEA